MSNETPTLDAKKRERLGSRYSSRIRRAGGLPAIVYGHGRDPEPVYLDAKASLEHIARGEKVFTVVIEGGATEMVLLKDLQYDYLGTSVVHADFARVDLDERVNTRAKVRLKGTPVGLKTAGAMLTHPVTELEIECTVTNLPDELEVDISHLEVGDSVHAREVPLPTTTMKLLTDPDAIVAQISFKAVEAETDEAGEVDATAEPEVISEKQDEDEKPGEGE